MASGKFVLTLEIWRDIKHHSFSFLLMLFVLGSAFSVVYLTHLNRQTTIELEQLYSQRDALDIEWRNLLLEQNALAEHSEIEISAQRKLEMLRPKPNEEVIIKLP
ncbi:cell division protein FtsL [Thalassotalea aquiviva]|uniref:cell division protein FtsL n=1 Tax=Thalassotalea aquiviva TaxID=3242415 RepID=UPI00352A24CF